MSPLLTDLVIGALRRVPTDRFRWRFLPWGLQLCEQSFCTGTEKTFRTRHGFRMKLDVSDWLGRHIYVTGEYESATTHLFCQRIRKGQCVLDIGANAGYFSCLSASLVGGSGRVISFEPVPKLNAALRENLKLNGFSSTNVHSVALSNEATKLKFHVGPLNHTGVSSLRSLSDESESIDVQVLRGDDVLKSVERVDFIKIDVEGAECHVLEGMLKTLGRFRPDMVIEITPEYLAGMNRTADDIASILLPLGYRFYVIENEGLRQTATLSGSGLGQYNAFMTVGSDEGYGLAKRT